MEVSSLTHVIKRNRLLTGLLVLLISGVISLLALALYNSPATAKPAHSSPATAKPPIRWTPPSVSETIEAGRSKSISVSFTAAQDLANVVVRVVPGLEHFVDVDTEAIDHVGEGEPVVVNLTLTVPENAQAGTIEGVIQLRDAHNETGNTLARPLPILISIPGTNPLFYINETIGYQVVLPVGFSAAVSPEPNRPEAQQSGLLEETIFSEREHQYGISLFTNSLMLDPVTWFEVTLGLSTDLVVNDAVVSGIPSVRLSSIHDHRIVFLTPLGSI